jgi:heat-inducible transcriptional repressor
MNGLSSRQQAVLGLVVREHVASTTPVGSQTLVGAYGLDISSATIRNEMALLEQGGYLGHPHTSAGRVPTAEGYRYFVQHLMGESELPSVERRTIRHQFHQARRGQMEQWLRLSATILARRAGLTALVTAPAPTRCHFRHAELLPLHGSRGTLVVILEEGIVEQQIFALEYPLSWGTLVRTSDQLNQLLNGRTMDEIRMIRESLSGLTREVADRILQIMAAQDVQASVGSAEPVGGQLFYEGLTTMLDQPEFADGEAIRRLVDLLDRPRLLRQILAESLAHSGVQVLIGGEGRWEALREYGMVLARYGVEGYALGALGLLGPIRMPYERAVSTARYMSELMSEIVRGLYG